MDLVSCKQCGLVYNRKNISAWDGSVFNDDDILEQLKCKVCNTYTDVEDAM